MPDEPVDPPPAAPDPASAPPLPPDGMPAGAVTTTGLPPNVAAGLAVVFSFISGIIFLILEKRSQFVRFWAMQSVVVGGALFIFNIATWILGTVLGHIPILGWLAAIFLGLVSMVVGLVALVLYVVMLIKAFSGQEWSVPVFGKIAREQLGKYPA
ncbi:MAG: hypothetical protein M3O82_04780 [Verrucomicrobiota bacterium]|nr:hypothetical protein [Verrucomicrobiota bacterium]